MKRIRRLYPNAVQLAYERNASGGEQRLRDGRAALERPQEVIANFVGFVRETEITDAESALVDTALGDLAVTGEVA